MFWAAQVGQYINDVQRILRPAGQRSNGNVAFNIEIELLPAISNRTSPPEARLERLWFGRIIRRAPKTFLNYFRDKYQTVQIEDRQ